MSALTLWKIAPWAIILILVTVCALQYAALKGWDTGRLQAVLAQNEQADALAGQLTVARQQADQATGKTTVQYVDRIKTVPGTDAAANRERDRIGTLGVRAILCGQSPTPPGCPPAAVPAGAAHP